MELYQFAISHYCEKVRWALKYKNVDHKIVSLVPGLHVFTIGKIAPRTHVPVLVDGETVVQNSCDILDYLEEKYPERPLTPQSSKEKHQACHWEKYADEEIGVHLRRYFYSHLLHHKKIVAPLLSTGASPMKKALFSCMFFKVKKIMRQRMNINEKTGKESRERLIKAIDKVADHLKDREFMVGDSFSRADLTVAALLAPIYEPEGYGLKWPKEIPEDMRLFREEHADKMLWVNKIYENYR
ncbi:glutathione S-transferase family protein [Candidatus Uabimicrobium amorphum]|uniref:Glutathione S-transferase n=1 Tax=Uabimicrobium amorphum TaxID=2596890 RepID=A0A5S9F5Z2_UABAM|nr:glutathione S-transferase family protein [Candidatus Uabimicrobium amorphum]BBM87365.1 glutathione S-transferase [Candidatus Uabimicrobium amorphum]